MSVAHGGDKSARLKRKVHKDQDDDEILETLLGELDGRPSKKAIVRAGSGFHLGDLKDPNISFINKAEDDDPN
jgi:hypothetical protein